MRLTVFVFALLAAGAAAAAPSRLDQIGDPDTKAWWALTEKLSGDGMDGRDTGSPAYQRAADLVAAQFAALGLVPAGNNGTFFQTVPLHQIEIEKAGTEITLERAGGRQKLSFLHDIDARPTETMPADLSGALTFRGYCGPDQMADAAGKILVCFGTKRTGLPSSAERIAAAAAAHAAGLIEVDDPLFTIEPPRWPDAYMRSVVFRGEQVAVPAGLVVMRMSDAAFTAMLAGSGHDAARILDDGGHKRVLGGFDIAARLTAHFTITQRDIQSPNVLAILPGSDPNLKGQYLVLSAHLDGYGHGEAVDGDSLYNGTLDDAAYVALLVRAAKNLKAGPLPRRSILFCVFTGEEKGLLGATWFTRHLTVPRAGLVADINLDQLRPLFPLNILTMHAVDETSLGNDARQVAASMAIEIRPDREPERGLLRRADNWPFMQIGVPATGFIFGYDPGTDAEKRYRQWYAVRYHRPQDDLEQPVDFTAAAKFDQFFYRLTRKIADDEAAPGWKENSHYRPK